MNTNVRQMLNLLESKSCLVLPDHSKILELQALEQRKTR